VRNQDCFTRGKFRGALLLFSALGLLFLPCLASASPITVFGTGEDTSGGRDLAYQIISDTTGEITPPAQAFVVTALGDNWTSAPGALWIGPAANQSNLLRNGCCTNTSDTYQSTFSLAGFIPSSAVLNFILAADDNVGITLNGTTVFTNPGTPEYLGTTSLSVTSGFVAGTNTLDFTVHNVGGPTGLDVAVTGTATSAVPEPSTAIPLALCGLVGGLWMRRRRAV